MEGVEHLETAPCFSSNSWSHKKNGNSNEINVETKDGQLFQRGLEW